MIVLSCDNIEISFGVTHIFKNISLKVENNDKLGIVGVNGAGKSTLMKIICGKLEADSGNVNILKDKKVVYLEQNPIFDSTNVLFDEIMESYSHLIEKEKELFDIEREMKQEKNEKKLGILINIYSQKSDVFGEGGGYEYKSRVKGILNGLGFTKEHYDFKVQSLSGGQKTRLAIAKILVDEPDILLIDEPTNHLDINTIQWLEDFLNNYKKTVILISHDRFFLDKVCNKIFDIENGTGHLYSGNYTEFCRKKDIEIEVQERHYENQRKEISRMEGIVVQQRQFNRARNIIAAESRLKAIDRIEKIERPEDSPNKMNVKFYPSIKSGNDVLLVENLTKAFPEKVLFENVSFEVKRNERVFLLGPNGCGKTTLLKILGETMDSNSGFFKYGHNVEIAYYSQEMETLNPENTIIDEIFSCNKKISETEIRNLLAAFLFKSDDVYKKIEKLSGGEKGRVALVKIIISGANFLLLDEPTNHLDINSKEVLEEALLKYSGTLLVVSHDRYFINKLANRFLEFSKTDINDFKGDYNYYIQFKKNLEKKLSEKSEESLNEGKLKHIEEKKIKAQKKRVERELVEIEERILEIEEEIEELDSKMILEEVTSDHKKLGELFKKKESLSMELENLFIRWDELSKEEQ